MKASDTISVLKLFLDTIDSIFVPKSGYYITITYVKDYKKKVERLESVQVTDTGFQFFPMTEQHYAFDDDFAAEIRLYQESDNLIVGGINGYLGDYDEK